MLDGVFILIVGIFSLLSYGLLAICQRLMEE